MGGSSIFFFGSAWDPPYDLLAEHGRDLRGEVEEVKAELQIAATIALLDRLDDLQPLLDDRPIVAFATEHSPRYPGRLPRGCLPM